jgi:hypothetical protein
MAIQTKSHGKGGVFKMDTAAAGGVQDFTPNLVLNGIKLTEDPDRPDLPTFGDLGDRMGDVLGLFDNKFTLAGYVLPSAATKVHGKGGRILQDISLVSAQLNTAKIGRKVKFDPTQTFGDTAKRYQVAGRANATFSGSGYVDYTASGIDAIMRAAKDADPGAGAAIPIVSVGLNGFAIGQPVDLFTAFVTKYDIDINEDKAITMSADWGLQDQMDLGVSLHDLVAETTTGATVNYTGVDEVNVSTQVTPPGGAACAVAHLHITAYSGFTSITIKIQDSADNVTFADLGTLNFGAKSATGSFRLTLPGNTLIRRYVRGVATTVGSGSCTFQLSFARRGYTYITGAGGYRHLVGLQGGYVNLLNGATLFELAPIGTTSGNPKVTGSCRLADFSYDLKEDGATMFSANCLVDGNTVHTVY